MSFSDDHEARPGCTCAPAASVRGLLSIRTLGGLFSWSTNHARIAASLNVQIRPTFAADGNSRRAARRWIVRIGCRRCGALPLGEAAGGIAEPEKPTPAPEQAPSPSGTIPAPANASDDAYALSVNDGSLGLHAAPGASLVVAPVMPTGAGLAVFYFKGRTGCLVYDLTHNFRPEYAKPFAPGSEVVPLIEVIAPGTGKLGALRADRVEKIHRVFGVYTPVEVADKYPSAPTKLPVMSECPEGMGEQYVNDAGAYPLVRRGETVIFDPSRRDLTNGAPCVIEWHGGTRDVVLTNFRQVGGQGEPQWWVDPVNRVGAGTVYTSDGPYDADHLRNKIVGTVVGVLVPRGERDEPEQSAPEPTGTTEPAPDETEPTEDSDDTELLRLGRLFEAARARDLAACSAVNEAQDTAEQREPARPACLIYRPSDHDLSVYGWFTMLEALEGKEVGSEDVARLRRKMPMTHEVLRPVREGESASIDHPGLRRENAFYPEAQARAEEIVAAWDAWRAEIRHIYAEHITPEIEAEADEAGEIALRLAEQIADLPAHTAAGLRVKLRALCHYDPASMMRTVLPESPDPD